jgi:hypothetical protein
MNAKVDWREILEKHLFDAEQFEEVEPDVFYGVVEGLKVGVAVASFHPQFERYGLNKHAMAWVRDAKAAGEIDVGFVVQTKVWREFSSFKPVEEVWKNIEAFERRQRQQ